ncbi:hypothetical protein J6590_023504 [Homalodisca vitripennis]|nr:hypothetical protein J6590_023504 [Homalodisca vitripennis]
MSKSCSWVWWPARNTAVEVEVIMQGLSSQACSCVHRLMASKELGFESRVGHHSFDCCYIVMVLLLRSNVHNTLLRKVTGPLLHCNVVAAHAKRPQHAAAVLSNRTVATLSWCCCSGQTSTTRCCVK